jgi:putative spermidine/putrescine transport system ATP-binding protein
VLRAVAGLLRPNRGRIALAGRTLFDSAERIDLPPERRHIGVVFQDYALFPHLTIAGNVAYGLRASGVARHEAAHRAAEALRRFGMDGLAGARPASLSGGERQRVALARAVAIRPRVLLLDEPLTSLDAALRERLRGELNRLLRTLGITAVYVTHDQAEAMTLGDRVVVMSKGAIAQIGTPKEIYFKPASRFVAEFIGAANIVEGLAAAGRLSLPGGVLPLVNSGATGPVSVMIRPEAISIVAPSESTCCGVVESVSFLGDRQRLNVSGVATRPITAEVANSFDVKVGEQVGVLIHPQAIRLLPGEER